MCGQTQLQAATVDQLACPSTTCTLSFSIVNANVEVLYSFSAGFVKTTEGVKLIFFAPTKNLLELSLISTCI